LFQNAALLPLVTHGDTEQRETCSLLSSALDRPDHNTNDNDTQKHREQSAAASAHPSTRHPSATIHHH
jgi:hypothetical protein